MTRERKRKERWLLCGLTAAGCLCSPVILSAAPPSPHQNGVHRVVTAPHHTTTVTTVQHGRGATIVHHATHVGGGKMVHQTSVQSHQTAATTQHTSTTTASKASTTRIVALRISGMT